MRLDGPSGAIRANSLTLPAIPRFDALEGKDRATFEALPESVRARLASVGARASRQGEGFHGSVADTGNALRARESGRFTKAAALQIIGEGSRGLTAASKSASGAIKAVHQLMEGSAGAEAPELAKTLGLASAGFAVVHTGLAGYHVYNAVKEINAGSKAATELQGTEFHGQDETGLKVIQANLEAVRKGDAAKGALVTNGILLLKGSAEIGKTAAEFVIAGGAEHVGAEIAAKVLGGPVSGIAAIGMGVLIYKKASNQEKVLEAKTGALQAATNQFQTGPKGGATESRPEAPGVAGAGSQPAKPTKTLAEQAGSAFGKLKEAADGFKAERGAHLATQKKVGIAKVILGAATLAVFAAGVIFAGSIALPVVGLGLIAAGLGVGIYAGFSRIRQGRTEKATTAKIAGALTADGKPSGVDSKSRTIENKAVASLKKTLALLARCNQSAHAADVQLRQDIMTSLTSREFVGKHGDKFRAMLRNLTPDEVDSKKFLLAELTKGMLGSAAN